MTKALRENTIKIIRVSYSQQNGFSASSNLCGDSVVTLGNFDGIHLGHQALLKSLTDIASASGYKRRLVLFQPHPSEFFARTKRQTHKHDIKRPVITRLREQIMLLAHLSHGTQNLVDEVIIVRFDRALSECDADVFVRALLMQTLSMRHLLVGQDFCFGKGRQGNVALLEALSSSKAFGLTVLSDQVCDASNTKVSSTYIRTLLKEGNITSAERVLGHPVFLTGRVIKGRALARQLGFRTANIFLKQPMALRGVYAVKFHILGDETPSSLLKRSGDNTAQWFNGVANIGIRPTVCGEDWQLEVHVLDQNIDLYNQKCLVVFEKKVRDEITFDSIKALAAQIEKDVEVARQYLKIA